METRQLKEAANLLGEANDILGLVLRRDTQRMERINQCAAGSIHTLRTLAKVLEDKEPVLSARCRISAADLLNALEGV